jgi:4-hydroxythreonine-4-phosphate dehydrogenase
MSRPIALGITLGDVGGIGPEVAAKAVASTAWPGRCRFVLIGSATAIAREFRALRRRPPPSVPALPCDPALLPAPACVWDPGPQLAQPPRAGVCTAGAARAAVGWIEAAVAACLDGRLSGMVTAPICKAGLHRAGIAAPGHTELLAELTHATRFAMMLIGGGLRVVLATRHLPLRDVPQRLTRAAVIEAAELAAEAMPWLGVRARTVGVCALNPHGGDGGALGREEIDTIAPAIRSLRARGRDVVGPIPADVMFHRARRGDFGAVVAMYHDQGLGPLKMVGFESGVNVTLGLPIVRTSPDHGTAFDIAGRGVANPSSMIAALRLAARLAARPNPWRRA